MATGNTLVLESFPNKAGPSLGSAISINTYGALVIKASTENLCVANIAA